MFVNRTEELRHLRGEVDTASNQNKVILLSGGTGVGKSALSDRLLQEEKNANGFKVVVPAGEHPPGTYIRLIARSMDASSSTHGTPSLQWFLKKVPSKDLRRDYDASLMTALAELEPTGAGKLVEAVTSRWLGRGQFDAARLFRSSDSGVVWLLVEYIRHVVANHRVLLNIENFQSIDYPSLEMLQELMKVQRQQFLLAEWTPEHKSNWALSDVRRIFESIGCSVHRFEIPQLPFPDLTRLIPSDVPHERGVGRLRARYESLNGNLTEWLDFLDVEARRFQLSDRVTVLPPDEVRGISSGTAERILLLSKDAIFVLTCIALHQGSAREDLLRLLTTRVLAVSYFDYDTARGELLNAFRVVEDGISLRVSHDWIVTTIRAEPRFERYTALALDGWAELYNDLHIAEDYRLIGKSEVLEHLFYFLAHTDIERLYGLVEDVKQFALSSIYPRATIGLLKKLQEVLSARYPDHPQELERIGYALLDIYYGLGLYPEAMGVLESLPPERARSTVYRALLLNRLDRHEEAIVFANTAIHRWRIGFESVSLYLQLVTMMSLRSMGRKREAQEVFHKVIRAPEYQGLPSYPYLLRNARLVIARENALPLLKESIVRFRELGNEVDEGHSRIALSMYLCMSGDLSRAHAELRLAQSLLEGRSMERHVLLNDLAVLRLLAPRPDLEDAYTLLNSARITATKRFDKIALANNLLILELLQKNMDAMQDLEGQLLRDLELEPDRALHRSVLFNLVSSAQTRGDSSLAGRLMIKLASNPCPRDAYWRSRIDGADGSDAYKKFYLQFPFHPVYLTNWHFPVVGC